jgi:hypothetical protein
MNKKFFVPIVIVVTFLFIVPVFAAPMYDKNPEAFINGILVYFEGQGYYFKGAPTGPFPAQDVPGHAWVQAGPTQFEGRHYAVGGPAPGVLWAPDEPTGVLLYMVHGILAPTSLDVKTENILRKQGYVHRHELVYATDPDGGGPLVPGDENIAIKVYLKHIAVRDFMFLGIRYVTPGVDHGFVPNW